MVYHSEPQFIVCDFSRIVYQFSNFCLHVVDDLRKFEKGSSIYQSPVLLPEFNCLRF